MMFGRKSKMSIIQSETKETTLQSPPYEFVEQGTLLFMTGVALSGKSTISPLVASAISGCVLQSMDVIRLAAQQIEEVKPERDRNPFVYLGSCDSYLAVGDGSYSDESLIEGFQFYSESVFRVAERMLPKLEAQGAQNVFFEGVQLTPKLLKPHLKGKNRLIVVTSDSEKLERNRNLLFHDDLGMVARYSVPILMLLQREIVQQGLELDQLQLISVANLGEYTETATQILEGLLSQEVIKKKSFTN